MNSQREEIVNLIYTLIYGKRRLKALANCKIAIIADRSYYDQFKGELDMQKLHAKVNFDTMLHLADSRIVKYIEGKQTESVDCDCLATYHIDDILQPERDHLSEFVTILNQIQSLCE